LRHEIARDGYTVVRGVVAEPWLAPAREAITAFVGDRTMAWGVVPIHHAAAFWAIRQLPAVHRVFAELHGTERLWVSIDRAIYKAPNHDDGSALHWDVHPRRKRPAYQGMLFLTVAEADGGPFECVPSLYRDLRPWLAAHPDYELGTPIPLDDHPVVPVPVRAGDLVLWDARLPHRGAPSRSGKARMSLAIAMNPVGGEREPRARVACWDLLRAPAVWRGWPGQPDPEPGPHPDLTALGRRLLGCDPW